MSSSWDRFWQIVRHRYSSDCTSSQVVRQVNWVGPKSNPAEGESESRLFSCIERHVHGSWSTSKKKSISVVIVAADICFSVQCNAMHRVESSTKVDAHPQNIQTSFPVSHWRLSPNSKGTPLHRFFCRDGTFLWMKDNPGKCLVGAVQRGSKMSRRCCS